MQQLRSERPPLIGNRRQGPDLPQIGVRRSAHWLKAHVYVPRSQRHPHHARDGFLFRDGRGDDLVAYLESLKGPGAQHLAAKKGWHLPSSAIAAANTREGGQIFQLHCELVTRPAAHAMEMSFKRMPPDLTVGPYFYLPRSDTSAQQMGHLAQIAKFGISGTDMPGHEYLPDQDVASLSLWLSHRIAQPGRNP